MCYFGNNWEKETLKNAQQKLPLDKKQEEIEERDMEEVIIAEK